MTVTIIIFSFYICPSHLFPDKDFLLDSPNPNVAARVPESFSVKGGGALEASDFALAHVVIEGGGATEIGAVVYFDFNVVPTCSSI